MSMYDLDENKKTDGIKTDANQETNIPSSAKKGSEKWKFVVTVIILIIGFAAGGIFWPTASAYLAQWHFQLPTGIGQQNQNTQSNNIDSIKPVYTPQTSQEEMVINAVKNYSSAVVSVIISKDVPTYERYYLSPNSGLTPFEQFFGFDFGPQIQIPQLRQNGTQRQQIGAGSGFIVSSDGLILTNKHVVSDTTADYTVITNNGKKYPAKVLARDPAQDLALLKIEGAVPFPTVILGDSSTVQTGQSVIAIGNALGQFDNSVSVGVVSGQQRTITAGDMTSSETLENLIQTDAAINEGNSGGPLLNLKGEVIGVNTAIAQGAQNIGFVIPINLAKRDIEQVKNTGKISYPYLGVRYVTIDDDVQNANKLPVDYGAWITSGDDKEAAVMDGSPAQAAGLKDGDIILEVDGQKIDSKNTLSSIIAVHNVGDKVVLTVLRGKDQLKITVVLGERK